MALGALRKLGFIQPGSQATAPGSGFFDVVDANDDARTAQSAADLLNPYAIDDAVFHWVELSPGITRVGIRARVDDALTTVTTDPIVRLFVSNKNPTDTTNNAATVCKMRRIDNADWNATGVTIDLVSSGSGMHKDGTNFYSDEPSLTGYDCLGGKYLGVAVETAAAINESIVVAIEVFGIN